MKILFVATDYPEKGRPSTGFPNYLYRVSLALIQMGHSPMIVAAGSSNKHRVDQGIDIWTIDVKYRNYKYQWLTYTVNAVYKSFELNKKIEEIIKKQTIDVIQFTSLEGSSMFYRGKVPAVFRLSSYAKTYFSSFQTYSANTVKIMSFIERYSARKCDAVFAPCRITANEFRKDCKKSVKVIETPFLNDICECDNQYYDRYLREKKYVLFFGSMYIEKGILVIADILERFLRENKEYYFVFVGDICHINKENSVQLLKRKAGEYADRVLIWKALPHKQLYPIIMRAQFVVLPSLMDNFPNACIEAMYFKRIVIGTDGASFEQLINHGINGLLCKIGDSEDLLDKIQTVISMNDDQKIEMGRMARRRIDKLKPEYTVKKLIQLYETVIQNYNNE